MGIFDSHEPAYIYKSDFSNGIDDWVGDGGTTLNSVNGTLVANRPGGARFKRDKFFLSIGAPHRITGSFSGSNDIDIYCWNGTWQRIHKGWNGTDPVVVTPISTSIHLRQGSDTFVVNWINVEIFN